MNMPTCYKDILWIDDMDSNDSITADLRSEKGKTLEEINKNPEKEKKFILADENLKRYIDMIQLSTTMKDAVDEIENNYNNYNLVIFDMNMNRGWGNKEQDVEYINEIFKSQNIKSFDHNDKIAGIYLYLFLLKKGYPANRMIIYTGNAKSTGEILNDNLYLDFKSLIKDKNNRIKLAENYYPKDGYYRIRRLVLQACDYWKAKIASKKDEDIPFNKIYFSKDTDKQISTENFKELLERVEMMFPVIQPASPEKVYYQAARILCEYHENKADIKILLKKVLYPFHMVCRNFRNWSSHNKFKDTQMPADIFALLLCITLRTYFDTEQKENEKFSDNVNDYEKIYFSGRTNVPPNNEKINGKISYIINDIPVKKIFFEKYSTEKIICSELLYKWGEIIDKNDIGDIFLSILFKNHTIKFNTEDFEKLFKTIFENDNQIDGKIFEVTINEIPIDNNKFTDLSFSETYRICCKNNNT